MPNPLINAEFDESLEFLFHPARYKVIWGGRGKGGSWGFARAALILGAQRRLRILCARETMKSLADSVHALLADQIRLMNMQTFYQVQHSTVIGVNGTEFIYAGLKHNVSNIKSLEGVDILWIEEAENVSKDSWETVIPTIRKDPANIYEQPAASEIWVGFNPKFDTDDTYRRFVVSPPKNAVVKKLSWRDNPWFPDVLRMEMEELRATDPDAYEHVYEGATKSSVEGAIYKDELRAAERGNRLTRVPYDATKPVDTFWDLGYSDMVTIWFVQAIAFEYRVIDFYQNRMKPIDFYLQALQQRGYTYGTCVLPWDGGAKQLGTGRSIEELIRAKGFKVRVMPQFRVADGINAVRTIFPQCYFDSEKCSDGISALRRYQWGPPPTSGKTQREPLHDDASHAADALRAMAVFIKPPKREDPIDSKPPVRPPPIPGSYSPFG